VHVDKPSSNQLLISEPRSLYHLGVSVWIVTSLNKLRILVTNFFSSEADCRKDALKPLLEAL